ncbi:MAG: DUF3450 family protein [Deltaproteobacteria bacterium]|nr:DUF3450 family protein [Deltaproteobacteria bacterium]
MKKLLFIALCICLVPAARGQRPEAEKQVRAAIDTRQQTQQQREQWAAERKELSARLEKLSRRREALLAEKARLLAEISRLSETVKERERAVAESAELSGDMEPLFSRVRKELSTLVETGPPYLLAERRAALSELDRVLADPEAKQDRKLSALFSALLAEARRASEVAVYRADVTVNGERILADVLALGRTALFFQSPDQKVTGVYHLADRQWRTVSAKYSRPVRAAMEMADQRRPADLVLLPLGRLEVP